MTTDNIPATIRALERRDPLGTASLRFALAHLNRKTKPLHESARKFLMKFAIEDAERLAASSRGEG